MSVIRTTFLTPFPHHTLQPHPRVIIATNCTASTSLVIFAPHPPTYHHCRHVKALSKYRTRRGEYCSVSYKAASYTYVTRRKGCIVGYFHRMRCHQSPERQARLFMRGSLPEASPAPLLNRESQPVFTCKACAQLSQRLCEGEVVKLCPFYALSSRVRWSAEARWRRKGLCSMMTWWIRMNAFASAVEIIGRTSLCFMIYAVIRQQYRRTRLTNKQRIWSRNAAESFKL